MPNARDPWGVLSTCRACSSTALTSRATKTASRPGWPARVPRPPTRSGTSTVSTSPTCRRRGPRPTYFDFDAFNEFNVTTGGTDLHADGRHRHQHGDQARHQRVPRRRPLPHRQQRLESGNVPDEMANDSRAGPTAATWPTTSSRSADYGFDLGGPIIKDKLWFYGTYGKQDIRLQRLTGTHDKTLLPSYNAKLNWQVTSEHDVLRLLLRREEGEVRPRQQPARAPEDDFLGTRSTPSRRAASRAACGRCRSTTRSRPASS